MILDFLCICSAVFKFPAPHIHDYYFFIRRWLFSSPVDFISRRVVAARCVCFLIFLCAPVLECCWSRTKDEHWWREGGRASDRTKRDYLGPGFTTTQVNTEWNNSATVFSNRIILCKHSNTHTRSKKKKRNTHLNLIIRSLIYSICNTRLKLLQREWKRAAKHNGIQIKQTNNLHLMSEQL